MAEVQSITIKTNMPDFKRQMAAFGIKLERRIVRSATNAAAQVFKKAVIPRAKNPSGQDPKSKRRRKGRVKAIGKNKRRKKGAPPRRMLQQRPPGTLAKAIYVYGRRSRKKGEVTYSVSFRKGKAAQRMQVKRKGKSVTVNRDAFYGRFLEDGWIPRGPGRKLTGGKRLRALKRERLVQGGSKEYRYPFLQPAFSNAQGAALAAFNAKMTERIAEANRERGN